MIGNGIPLSFPFQSLDKRQGKVDGYAGSATCDHVSIHNDPLVRAQRCPLQIFFETRETGGLAAVQKCPKFPKTIGEAQIAATKPPLL